MKLEIGDVVMLENGCSGVVLENIIVLPNTSNRSMYIKRDRYHNCDNLDKLSYNIVHIERLIENSYKYIWVRGIPPRGLIENGYTLIMKNGKKYRVDNKNLIDITGNENLHLSDFDHYLISNICPEDIVMTICSDDRVIWKRNIAEKW